MKSIEKSAPTVEEAVTAALQELGADATDVMVEVLEEPTNGLLGFGAKPARVRVVLMASAPPPPTPDPTPQPTGTDDQPSQKRESRPRRNDDRPRRPRNDDRRSRPTEDPVYDLVMTPAPDEVPPEEADEIARYGFEVVNELLQHMGYPDARVSIHRADASDEEEGSHWLLNIYGENLSPLVGRRGDTLASLQYIVRLIVSRRSQQHTSLIVDVGQYKAGRSERLMQLAHRMADKAIADERTISLEPMPPHERRIIHLALRERADVETFSVGEGRTRKVTIAPNLD